MYNDETTPNTTPDAPPSSVMTENGPLAPVVDTDDHASAGQKENLRIWPSQVSQRKIEANRANGDKGGVKTEDGKRRSRRNALKHGMRATTLLMSDEDGPEGKVFSDVRRALEQEYEPRTVTEHLLVQKMALAVVRSQSGFQHELRELRAKGSFHLPALDRLTRYHTAADKVFYKAQMELEILQKDEVDEG